jgi:glycosyltransferase involved in cell wall biosynthesis
MRPLARPPTPPESGRLQASKGPTPGDESDHPSPVSICLVGGLFPKDQATQIESASKGPVQTAANTLQWHFVEGLDEAQTESTTIITAPFVGSYPTLYRHMIIPGKTFSHTSGASDVSIGFLNLPIIKHFSRAWGVRQAVRKWVRETPGDKVLIAYSLHFEFMRVLASARSADRRVVRCVIVPDLPEYMNTSNRTTLRYRILKSIEIWSIHRDLKFVDAFVLVTEQMSELLPSSAPYVVLEGIAASRHPLAPRPASVSPKTILYAGTLNARYGIVDLVRAFQMLDDPTLNLTICGGGDSEEFVRDAAAVDRRIKFLGRVPHDEAVKLQAAATILVNPRTNDEEFAKYSFPSKILEYMSVGRPVVAYELDGMPKEYGDYVFYVPTAGTSVLAETIASVCEMSADDLDEIGARAKRFVDETKNPRVQVGRVLAMLESVRQMTDPDIRTRASRS